MKSQPPRLIRNKQSGDWWFNDDRIIAAADERLPDAHQFLIGIHESIEAWRCRQLGITDKRVIDFDELYEKEREDGKHPDDSEPGDDPRSPYRIPHQDATHVERAACLALGIKWSDHEKVINQLGRTQSAPQTEEAYQKNKSPFQPHPVSQQLPPAGYSGF